MRVVIVDKEPLARLHLLRLCRASDDVEVIAQAETGIAAIQAIRTQHPDVLLLDVELPDMTGFELLRSLRGDDAPLAIMVTAHPQHALAAFEVDAIDYLTKPVSADRFREGMRRARSRCAPAVNGSALNSSIKWRI